MRREQYVSSVMTDYLNDSSFPFPFTDCGGMVDVPPGDDVFGDIQLPIPLGKSVVGAWRFDFFKGFKCFLL